MKKKQQFTVRERQRRANKYFDYLKEHPGTTITKYEKLLDWNKGTLKHYINEYNDGKFDGLTEEELDSLTIKTKKPEVKEVEKIPETKIVAKIDNTDIYFTQIDQISRDVALIHAMMVKLCKELG